MALEKAVRGFTVIAVFGLTYRLSQLVEFGGSQSNLTFVGSVLVLAYLGLGGLVRDISLVGIVSGFLLFGAGFVLFLPPILVAGMALLVDGVSSVTPRLTGSAPA